MKNALFSLFVWEQKRRRLAIQISVRFSGILTFHLQTEEEIIILFQRQRIVY